MITEIDGFTLCAVLDEHEGKETLNVTVMSGEKIYQGNLYSHMKPDKLVDQSGQEWLQFVYNVIRQSYLNSADSHLEGSCLGRDPVGLDHHKISVSEKLPCLSLSSSSSSSVGILTVSIVLSLEDGGEILKAQFSLPERSNKAEAIISTFHELGYINFQLHLRILARLSLCHYFEREWYSYIFTISQTFRPCHLETRL